ncbi:hypothetical protein J7443_11480 [Tropicibacter sp. R15_0]|uniref:hypothetical protein n=1 Tax=Tropicibacter sp. R15_0 TaxID=2821101 RepID=UPI001ADAC40E|nr:hypothetical protein [Tropicibacter sp. R15_0]MBO9465853.1 hypothetical protein [Tropicibacter sp. R15_0]
MSPLNLQSDCANCAGLCCMVFAFEKGSDFAIDKPAGQGCPHLDAGFGCKIYGQREEAGFAGCLRFDCLGAGQRVSQDYFADQDWRDTPAIIPEMIELFRKLREVHRLYELLSLTQALPLPDHLLAERERLMLELHPTEPRSKEALLALDEVDLKTRVDRFLSGLRTIVRNVSTPNKP